MIDRGAPTVEVIYIAFHDYGSDPIQRFLSSYRCHSAAFPHALKIALKGYDGSVARESVVTLLSSLNARHIEVPHGGFDIGTYFHLADTSSADILCLMNSNAEILGDAWLAKLVTALREQGGGAVSATGSWESLASDQWRSPVVGVLPFARRLSRVSRMRRGFPLFPNPHLRTNALVIERRALLGLKPGKLMSKEDAWRFESGRGGLSATLRARKLPLRVVGRDGRAYGANDWNQSNTFWQGDQANLLVADNQTRRYQEGTLATRAQLQSLAWNAPAVFGRRQTVL